MPIDGARGPNSPRIALDRFIRALECGQQVSDRFSEALATICDSTNAQLAFVYTDSPGRVTEMVGAAGEAIPPLARILAVADSCDAMMSARRYRPALTPARIEANFHEGSGTQWDPRIVQCFFACRHELYAVCQRGLGHLVYMAVERAAGGDSTDELLAPRDAAKTSLTEDQPIGSAIERPSRWDR